MTLVNQAFGREVADSVILAIGDRLDRCLRASDVVGRSGGDKFGAILVNCPETELRSASEKILETARNTIVETPSGPIHVTVSVGAVNFPMKVRTAADAMTKADIALRDAKQFGRDCFAIYDCAELQQKKIGTPWLSPSGCIAPYAKTGCASPISRWSTPTVMR